MTYHAISYNIIYRHAISYNIISCHTIACSIIQYHILPYHTMLYHTVLCHIKPFRTMQYHTVPHHIIPAMCTRQIMLYHIIPCHTIPCNTNTCTCVQCKSLKYDFWLISWSEIHVFWMCRHLQGLETHNNILRTCVVILNMKKYETLLLTEWQKFWMVTDFCILNHWRKESICTLVRVLE